MHRRARLFQEWHRRVATRHFNAPSYRRNALGTLKDALNILTQQGQLPAKLGHLSEKHVLTVVEAWKARGYQRKTLQNKLAILKKLFALTQNKHEFPLVVDLGNKKTVGTATARYEQPLMIDEAALLASNLHAYVKTLLQLQWTFGLTRQEAFLFSPITCVEQDALFLPSNLSFNGRERRIIARIMEQKTLLAELADKEDFPSIAYPAIKHFYEVNLQLADLPRTLCCRKYYARKTYAQLNGTHAEKIAQLSHDMGYQTLDKVRGYLRDE